MRSFYNVLFGIGFIASAPFYFLKMLRRGSWREDFGQRFGIYSSKLKQAFTNRSVIWLHAVSVGEVNICTQLISALEPALPNIKFAVSTTTSTGMSELHKKLPRHIEKIYYPIDRRKFVSRAMRVIHPEAIILVEAEIWPNFLWRAQKSGTPVFLVNARLSEKSFRGYRRAGFLFRPIFASLSGVGAQNESDAARLRELGCAPERIRVVGNLKFDSVPLSERPPIDFELLLRNAGFQPGALILLGGSTHAGEEALLADIFKRLRSRFPDLFLVLVPRHFERGKEVGDVLAARGIPFVYRSELTSVSPAARPGNQCLLVNTTGELRFFYPHASVVFVGKSLAAQGGQNPIEPAAAGAAVVFGPNMQNFTAIAQAFVSAKGAVQVRDAVELERTIDQLLRDAGAREELSRNAKRVVRENKGSIDRTVDMILETLAKPSRT